MAGIFGGCIAVGFLVKHSSQSIPQKIPTGVKNIFPCFVLFSSPHSFCKTPHRDLPSSGL